MRAFTAVRHQVTAAVVLITAIAVVSYRTSVDTGAVATPEARQLIDTTDVNNPSDPTDMVMLGSTMFFSATRDGLGRELWKLDTTNPNAQPVLVMDINPSGDSSPAELTLWNDKVVFRASNGVAGIELWTTRGSVADTMMVKDINVGAGSGYPTQFSVAGPRIYFVADDGFSGSALWTSDGTGPGTVKVSGVGGPTNDSNPYNIVLSGGKQFFIASDGVSGNELWVSDGTAAGTRLVKDIYPGSAQGAIEIYGALNGGVMFRGVTEALGYEPYFSDGTASGTYLLKDIAPGNQNSEISTVTLAAGKLYFGASDFGGCCPALPAGRTGHELWATDGTPSGTLKLTDASPNAPDNQCWWCYRVQEIRPLNNGVVARMNTQGADVWFRSNGTVVGTVNMDPDPNDLVYSTLTGVRDGLAYFQAGSSITGAEPWVTDGSPSGTRTLGDINPTTQNSDSTDFVVFGSPPRLMYRANDGAHGNELWVSDLTAAGTYMVKDINTQSANNYNSDPQWLVAAGSKVYFRAYQPTTGWEMWVSDGTEAGTSIIELKPGTDSPSFDQFFGLGNGSLLFRYNDGLIDHEPWVTDGTLAGTRSLGNVNPNGNTEIRSAARIGSRYLMILSPGDYWSLWSIGDGQTTPVQLTPACGNGGNPDVQDMRVLTNGVLIRVSDCVTGHKWWRSDGTPTGTVPLQPIGDPVQIGSRYYFTRNEPGTGTELWITDGSPAGTHVLVDINTSNTSSEPEYGIRIGSKYVFPADDGVHGRELWVSDGTPSGTVRLTDINTTNDWSGGSYPQWLTKVGNKVFFRAWSPGTGWELGATDGTVSGTRYFDLNPGGNGSDMDQLRAAGDRAFFRRHSVATGWEVWVSDGTESGTHLLRDMNPGGGGVEFNDAGFAGGRYVLRIYDNQEPGWTLWGTDGTSANTVRLTSACPGGGDASPGDFRWLTGGMVFAIYSCGSGWRYWRTDGTVVGTVPLDLVAGDAYVVDNISQMGDKVLYRAANTTNGLELWSTDGSTAGTIMLTDIAVGTRSAEVQYLTVAGSNIFYTADDGAHGRELWVSDGTTGGSHLVKDLTPPSRGNGSTYFDSFVALGDRILYRAYNHLDGWEVYTSDGTEAGTARLTTVVDDNTYPPSSAVRVGNRAVFVSGTYGDTRTYFTDFTTAGTSSLNLQTGADQLSYASVVGSKIFARTRTDSLGEELFISDGTVGGTSVVDLRSGANGSDPYDFRTVGSGVVFRAHDGVNSNWFYSDGTVAGTGSLDPNFSDNTPVSEPAVLNGSALYTAQTAAEGWELWKWSPSSTPTLVVDRNPGVGNGANGAILPRGNKVYYIGNNGSDGSEPFVSDGTAGGTQMLVDLSPGTNSPSNAQPFGAVGQFVLVRGNIAGSPGVASVKVADGASETIAGTSCGDAWPFGTRVILLVDESGRGCEPIITDGTVAGTQSLGDLQPGSAGSSLSYGTVSGDKFFFTAEDSTNGRELWVTDGTAGGTIRLSQFAPGNGNSVFSTFYPLGSGRVLFNVCACQSWKWAVTDGTVAGTKYLDPDLTDQHDVGNFAMVNGSVVFGYRESGSPNDEPYLWNGSTGTVQSLNLHPYTSASASYFTAVGGIALFAANNGLNGLELWRTDGTAGGTEMVVDTNVEAQNSDPAVIVTSTTRAVFSAWDYQHGRELWITDGTVSGTTFVKDLQSGVGDTGFGGYTTINGRFVFQACESTYGCELWSTNGTGAGTQLLADVNTNPASYSGHSYPDWFQYSDDNSRAFFRAFDGTERDLWTTDGTPSGTFRVASINPGDDDYESRKVVGSKFYFRKTVAGQLYFYAADATTQTVTQLKALDVSQGGGDLNELRGVGDRVVFRLYNQPTVNNTWQYWTSDGTVSGTRALDGDPTDNRTINDGLIVGHRFYYVAPDGAYGRELHVLDGNTGVVTVLDVNPTGSSYPDSLVAEGSGVRFRAEDGVHGREWWTSDGTVSGTRIDADVATGAGSGNPNVFTMLGGYTYFKATSAQTGTELWRTDGTTAGTTLVKDMVPGNMASDISYYGVSDNKLVLSYYLAGEGSQLWVSDGTDSGTVRLGDFNPTGDDQLDNISIASNRIYFRASDGTTRDMWVSDGTVAGTRRVDLTASANDEFDSPMPVGSRLIFRLPVPGKGRELFITDGTPQGTEYLGEIEVGAGDVNLGYWTAVRVGNTTLFQIYQRPNQSLGWQWWRTDGTPAGTVPFDLDPTNNQVAESLTAFGNRLFFTDDDGTGRKWYELDGVTGLITPSSFSSLNQVTTIGNQKVWQVNDGVHGTEIWKSDVAGSFSLIEDVNPVGAASGAERFVTMGGATYFTATNGVNGTELWKSVGTAAPVMVKNFVDDRGYGYSIGELTVVGSRIYFVANSPTLGIELWSTDGTSGGTQMVKDINPNNDGCYWCDVWPDNLNEVNGKVVFRGGLPNDREVWVSDGTASGTVRLADINPSGSSDADQFVKFGNRLYFRARNAGGRYQLWSTDGTVSGTTLVKDIHQNGDVYFDPSNSFTVGNNVVLRLYEPNSAWQYWYSDGTPSGTFLIDPYPTDGNWPEAVVAVGARVLVNAADQNGDRELWVIDQSGQRSQVGNFVTNGSSNPTNFRVDGTTAYFSMTDPRYGRELFKTDGTLAGTELVADVNLTSWGNSASTPKVSGSRIVFRHQAAGEWELGLANGTSAIRVDLNPSGSSDPDVLLTVGNKVVFTAYNGTERQLWVSDGTLGGTGVVLDVNPTGNDSVGGLVLMDGRVFFNADDGVNGNELWVTDGTAAGTRMLTNMNTTSGSNASVLYASGNRILVAADDGITGMEMYITNDGVNFSFLGDNNPIGHHWPQDMIPLGTGFLYRGYDSARTYELWFTDGTAAGTRIVADINPFGQSSPQTFTAISPNRILFKADDGEHGFEPWVTDGTAEGTFMLDVRTGTENGGGSDPNWFTAANGRIYMSAYTDTRGRELWVTDGTLAGTRTVDINMGGSLVSNPPMAVGSNLMWTGNDGTNGTELWLSNGTTTGTRQIDINTVPSVNSGNSSPIRFTEMGSTTYFVATDGIRGSELWRTDGTVTNTQLVRDINPGEEGGQPEYFFKIGDRYVFRSNSPDYGSELWVSDGTLAGSEVLKDIRPGRLGSDPFDFVESNGRLFFKADDGVHGREVWSTDGTRAGTRLAKDVFPHNYDGGSDIVGAVGTGVWFGENNGINGWAYYFTNGTEAGTKGLDNNLRTGGSPELITVLGYRLVYRLDDGVHGSELWSFDGVTGARSMIADINPGSASSDVVDFTVGVSKAYFTANNGINGRELWVTDGTAAGTRMVRDINPTGNLDINYRVMLGDQSLFLASDGTSNRDLWVSDGTEAGTHLLKDLQPGSDDLFQSATPVSTLVYFRSTDPVNGSELWRTDGTTEGTFMVKDFNPSGDGRFDWMVAAGDRLYLRADDGVHGLETWTSDGTTVGTLMLADVNTTAVDGGDSSSDGVIVGSGFFLFHPSNGTTREWWISDGTVAGTRALRVPNQCPGTDLMYLTPTVNRVLFSACDTTRGWELWRSDGTPGGTTIVSDGNPNGSSNPWLITSFADGTAAFRADDGTHGSELWVSDASGARMAANTNTTGTGSDPSYLTVSGNRMFFSANDGEHGYELWVTDTNGPRMVADIRPGVDSSYPESLVAAGLTGVYFRANDGVHGTELWYSDGTTAGTRLVKDLRPSTDSSATAVGSVFGYLNGRVYFQVFTDATGLELGVSDGTANGTVILDLRTGTNSSDPNDGVVVGNRFYFTMSSDTQSGRRLATVDTTLGSLVDLLPDVNRSPDNFRLFDNQLAFVASSDQGGRELWLTDGTVSGTRMVSSVNEAGWTNLTIGLVAGSRIYFMANSPTIGRELFSTDGSPGGVVALDLNPNGDSNPEAMGVSGSTFYFSAEDGTHGREMFATTGTLSNTSMVDINPTGGSGPYSAVVAGSNLFFVANDGVSGHEPWVITGGWTPPVTPNVVRTGTAPSAPVPIVRPVANTVPRSVNPEVEVPFEQVTPVFTLPTLPSRPSTTAPSVTNPPSDTPPPLTDTQPTVTAPPFVPPQVLVPPAGARPLLNPVDQDRLETPRGRGAALLNGVNIPVEVLRVSGPGILPNDPNRTPEAVDAIRAQARLLVARFNGYLGDGSEPRVNVIDTPRGASIVGLLVDPMNPELSIPVPAESVIVLSTDSGAMMVAGMNNTGSPSPVTSGGVLQVSTNGYLGLVAAGLPPAEFGQFLLFSTPKVLGEFTTAADGGFTGQVRLPGPTPTGGHSVVVKTRTLALSLGIQVVPGVSLPATGANSTDHLRFAALFVLVGVAVLTVRRRRSHV